MNLQLAFDEMADHMLQQNKRSVTTGGSCKYLGPNGLKCGVGGIIPDHLYDESMEEKVVADIFRNFDGLWSHWSNRYGLVGGRISEFIRLCNHIQAVHDDYDPDDWPARLKKVAEQFNLEWSGEKK